MSEPNSAWRGFRSTVPIDIPVRPKDGFELSPRSERFSRWMTLSEMEEKLTEIEFSDIGKSTPKGGGVVLWSDGKKALIDTGMSHTLIVAMTDSGKTKYVELVLVFEDAGQNKSYVLVKYYLKQTNPALGYVTPVNAHP